MRTHMGSIYSGSPWGRLTAPLMKGRRTKVILRDGGFREVTPLHIWTPGPSSPSLICTGASSHPLPRPSKSPRDRWPSACEYCTIFQFPARGKRNFRGWVKFRGTVWRPLSSQQAPASCWRPADPNRECLRNQVLSVSTKHPLLAPSRPTVAQEDADRRPDSLSESRVTTITAHFIYKMNLQVGLLLNCHLSFWQFTAVIRVFKR